MDVPEEARGRSAEGSAALVRTGAGTEDSGGVSLWLAFLAAGRGGFGLDPSDGRKCSSSPAA